MRRHGMQPMVVINSGDPLPDLVIVTITRWLWRYRSELAPLNFAAAVLLTAWALHASYRIGGRRWPPRPWPSQLTQARPLRGSAWSPRQSAATPWPSS